MLAENSMSQSIRQVALRAGVSPSRAAQVLEGLAELGIVERYHLGSQLAVRLVPENVAAKWILALGSLWRSAIDSMREAARIIYPAPLSLTVFGSFARGTAQAGSDVDVLAVHANDLDDAESEKGRVWVETLGQWSDLAGRITGNPVSLIDLAVDDLRREPLRVPVRTGTAKSRLAEEVRREAVQQPAWRLAASREGIVLVGNTIAELIGARKVGRG